jgi:double-strand break repair protein MRE11
MVEAPVASKSMPKRAAATRGRQTQLTFTQPSQAASVAQELSDDEISDDDAFNPTPASSSRRR